MTWPGMCGAVQARLFRRLPRVSEETWAAADGWNSATASHSRAAPVGYRTVIIAKCTHGELRDRGAQQSVTAESTAFNAGDSGHGGESAHFDE